jgi:hypothetical protein
MRETPIPGMNYFQQTALSAAPPPALTPVEQKPLTMLAKPDNDYRYNGPVIVGNIFAIIRNSSPDDPLIRGVFIDDRIREEL